MDHDPPRTPAGLPPIRTDQDLHRTWSTLLGPLGFSVRRLWLAFLDEDGRMHGPLAQIDDLPVRADEASCRTLLSICAEVLGDPPDGRSCAVLLTRPGRDPVSSDDRRWARALAAAARSSGVALWPTHLANDRELVVFAPDDMLAPR